MSGKYVYLHSNDYQKYKFSPAHPFNPLRLDITMDLLQTSGLLLPEEIAEPQAATREDLCLVHSSGYVAKVEAASITGEDIGGLANYGLGTEDNPVFPDMHQACSLIVGSTITAARMVMEGQVHHAVNLAGGLHHAHRSQASGFCIYNDAAVAIAWLKQKYGSRVVYIDIDAHHGDGVQWLFYEDPDVLTISFHETGRYLFPGTGGERELGRGPGYGYSLNIPLEAFTEDQSWLEGFRRLVIPAVQEFKPDLIISQNGCDGHWLDPLSDLCATLHTYREIPRLVHQLAHEAAGGRWVVLGGGGYDYWRVVPRAWTWLWAEVTDRTVPEHAPAQWLARWQSQSPVPMPEKMMDNPRDYQAIPRRGEIEEKNALTVDKVLGAINQTWLKQD